MRSTRFFRALCLGCMLSLSLAGCTHTRLPSNTADSDIHSADTANLAQAAGIGTPTEPLPPMGPAQSSTPPALIHIPDPADPFEGVNRAIFRFNDALDRAAFKPLAKIYNHTLPRGIRTSITSFFSNIADVYTMLNNYLQGNITAGSEDLMRVSINSVFGILGLFDIATPAGLPKHQEDFGQTLGHYGIRPGPYLVLPFLGPSTVRDAAGFVVDRIADPTTYIHKIDVRNQLYALRFLSTRASYLEVTGLMNRVSLDQYISVRNAYLQRRDYVIHGDTQALPNYEDDDDDDASDTSNQKALAKKSMPATHILPPGTLPGLRIR